MSDTTPSTNSGPKHNFEDCKCQETPGTSGGDDCIAKWKNEKIGAESTLKGAIATVELRSEALKHALAWEAKLKMYFDNIYKTAELADKVARELDGFKDQTDKVCINADCTIMALEILFCEVREIFEPNVRFLITTMNRVNDCLKCITDPGLVRDDGILRVLAEYDEKLREMEALQLDAMKKIIEALKCANILYYSICSANETNKSKEEYLSDALGNELDALCKAFGVSTDSTGNASPSPYAADPWICADLTTNSQDSSATVLELLPSPTFPLSEDLYYTNTASQHSIAQADKNTKKAALDEAKKEKESAQACFESLVSAIDTAEKAKRGN